MKSAEFGTIIRVRPQRWCRTGSPNSLCGPNLSSTCSFKNEMLSEQSHLSSTYCLWVWHYSSRAGWETHPMVCKAKIFTTYLAFNKNFADHDLRLSLPVFPHISTNTHVCGYTFQNVTILIICQWFRGLDDTSRAPVESSLEDQAFVYSVLKFTALKSKWYQRESPQQGCFPWDFYSKSQTTEYFPELYPITGQITASEFHNTFSSDKFWGVSPLFCFKVGRDYHIPTLQLKTHIF